jgi:hypothetical protein
MRGAQISPFAPDQFEEACDFLGILGPLRPALAEAIASIKIRLARSAPTVAGSNEPTLE